MSGGVPTGPRPAAPAARLAGVDAARCLALLGMMAVHVLATVDDDGELSLAHGIAGGRAAALFAVLAGVGIALGTGGPTPPTTAGGLGAARRAVAARAAVVAVVGLTLASVYPTPIAIILPYYGVLFLVALPVLGWTAGRLAAAATASVLLAPPLSHLIRAAIGETKGPSTDWADLIGDPVQTLVQFLIGGYYPALTWSSYLLLGLAVGRLPLREPGTVRRVLLLGGSLAAAGWAAGRLTVATVGQTRLAELLGTPVDGLEVALADGFHGTTPTGSAWFLGLQAPHLGSAPDLVHTGGTALVALVAMLLLVPHARLLTRPLVAAGSMTLTLYSLHVLAVGWTDRSDWAAELPGRVYALQVCLALLLATAWGSPARRGPLEQLAHAAARGAARARASR